MDLTDRMPDGPQVSLMEIYNETIRDLVEPKDEGGEDKKLDVKL